MNEDEMICAALARIADRAPASGPVVAGLERRARIRRQRRAVLAVTGSAIAVGALGTVPAVRRAVGPPGPASPSPDSSLLPPSNGPAAVPPRPGGVDVLEIPLRYRPARLPAGFVETGRRAELLTGGHRIDRVTRIWTQPRTGALVELQTAAPAGFDLTGMRAATVAGRAGWVREGPGDGPLVVWDGTPYARLGVRIAGTVTDPLDVAHDVADSIVVDGAGFEVSLHSVRTLDQNPRVVEISRVAGTAREHLSVLDGAGRAIVDVIRGARVPRPAGGRRTALRGRAGQVRWDASRRLGWAWVELGDGDQLYVRYDGGPGSAMDAAELVRMVNDFRIGPRPDTSWLGGS